VTYAVGDVHGRADLVDAMLAAIDEDAAGRDVRTIFIGDYVDRGPDSRIVIERLLAPPPALQVTCLLGNHERLMLDALDGGFRQVLAWHSNGGLATIRSYGGFDIDSLRLMMPREHEEWIRALPLYVDDGERLFVHAGIRPGVPIEEQDEDEMLWIRARFLDSDVDHGRLVVHGHTIVDRPEVRTNRVGIDTGAYDSGVLTCAAFDGRSRVPRIIQVRAAGRVA
jgi:serine/threonine protein phosphatase 1